MNIFIIISLIVVIVLNLFFIGIASIYAIAQFTFIHETRNWVFWNRLNERIDNVMFRIF